MPTKTPATVKKRDLMTTKYRVPADRHAAKIYLAHLAEGSRRTMRHALDTIAGLLTSGACDAASLPWPQLRYQHTTAVRSALADRYAPAMVNKMLAALRGVLKECWRLGQMAAEDYHRAVDLPAVRGKTLPRGRALSGGELRALFETCAEDDTPAGARDGAMLALLYGAGLRRSELAGLERSDYDRETGELRIRGKGRKERTAYATNGSQDALEAWLTFRGDQPGPLFCPINKGGRLSVGQGMTDQAVLYRVRKRAEQAGVPRFTPHDLRRSFISDLLDQGADIVTVQQMAGHASVSTTGAYDRRGEAAKRKAAELLYIPFGRKWSSSWSWAGEKQAEE